VAGGLCAGPPFHDSRCAINLFGKWGPEEEKIAYVIYVPGTQLRMNLTKGEVKLIFPIGGTKEETVSSIPG
jgi:hypothetical protein